MRHLVPRQFTQSPDGLFHSVLDDLTTATTNAKGAMESATTFISGFGARLQAAVDAAIAGGATAAQLQPVQAEVDALNTDAAALSAAIAANP